MKLSDLITIIYCSSNQEAPKFEERIRDNILKNCRELPIISVTQKPIDFGTNICVGDDVGVSGFNFFRQSLIACKAAKTRFVLSCEADCLYPKDYFTFIPERDDVCYRNKNLYVMAHKRAIFWKKEKGATHAQIVNRELYIKVLEELFEGEPEWSVEQKNFPKEKFRGKREDVFAPNEIIHYTTKNPIFQFKTSDSMRHFTVSDRIDRYEIPYWGNAKKLREEYLK